MQFGISTHLYHDERLTRGHLAEIAASGFECVELYATRSHFDYHDEGAIARLAEWLRDTGLELTSVHAPITDRMAGGRWTPAFSTAATDQTRRQAALRETEEELGLARDRVEVLARMPQYCTRTGFCVTPVVGVLAPPLVLVPDRREVEEVFEVPLGFLLDPRNHERRTREYQGQMVGYYVIQYGERHIWGATAGMIVNLYRMLG